MKATLKTIGAITITAVGAIAAICFTLAKLDKTYYTGKHYELKK